LSQPVEPEVQQRELVYLDNAQTTRLDPTILVTMNEFMVNNYGVPGGEFGYRLEEEAREAIEQARERRSPEGSTLGQKRQSSPRVGPKALWKAIYSDDRIFSYATICYLGQLDGSGHTQREGDE
jgi:hypothetical protein